MWAFDIVWDWKKLTDDTGLWTDLGDIKSISLYAFTGCDQVYFFANRGKKSHEILGANVNQ